MELSIQEGRIGKREYNFIQKINQDYSKLESTHKMRLMKDYFMVVFIRNCEKEIVDKIKSVERNKLKIISA